MELVKRCQRVIANVRAMNKDNLVAMREINKIASHVEPRKVIDTILGMYLMYYLEGRRFRSDPAFRTQLVRRVRGLTKQNARTWLHPETGKPKTTYGDLTPREASAMAELIIQYFGLAGVTIAKMVREDEEKSKQDRLTFYSNLEELV